MKNLLPIVFLLLFCNSIHAQNGIKKEKKATLISNTYNSTEKAFSVVVLDFDMYNSLQSIPDENITDKYTSVPGISTFSLVRNNLGRISSKIKEDNAAFLLDQYLNLDEKDIELILSSKNK